MSETPDNHAPADLQILALRYLDSDLSSEELQTLQDQLLSDRESAKQFARLVQMASFVREQVRREEAVRKELSLSSDKEVKLDEFLAALMPPEDLPPIKLATEGEAPATAVKHEPVTFAQVADVTWQLFINSRAPLYVASGIAAAIILAGILYFTVTTGNDSPTRPPFAESADGQAEDAEPQQRPVATLTAQSDAQWLAATGAVLPRVGDWLRAGERLSLASGYAEITTQRGAVAVLEAPCTIELTDENSLYLYTGKLLGVCDTESSKGFLVRTRHMDVTDLGTRFGVDATQADVTEVHVFSGEVLAALPREDASVQPRVVTSGLAVAAGKNNRTMVDVEPDTDRFARIQQAIGTSDRGVAQIQGIRSIAGQVQLESASRFAGQDANLWPTGENAVVFHDFVGRLNAEARVNISEPGTYESTPQDAGSNLPAGTNLRSYIIYKSGNATDTTTTIQGSVTFEGEVIGIITDEAAANTFVAAIRATSPVFTPGPGADRWIDLYTFQEGLTLSEDRRTVTFQFQVKRSTDVIRVLVRAD